MKTNKKNSVLNILFISVVLSFILPGTLFSQETFEKFKFYQAYAEREINTNSAGVKMSAFEEIHILDHGNKMAIYRTEKTEVTMANIVEEKRSVTIHDGEWVITYDPDTKEGKKMKIDMANKLQGMSEEDMKKFAEKMGDAMGTDTKDIGTKEIAGITCNGTEATTDMMGMKIKTTIYQYGGLTFESVSKGAGTNHEERITKFIEGADIDLKKLNVPSKINIEVVKSPFKNDN